MSEGPEAMRLFASPEGLRELARLLGSSAFLWEDFLRRQLDNLRPVLEDWRRRPLRDRVELANDLGERLKRTPSHEEQRQILNDFKDEEMLLADMKYLLDPYVSLQRFSRGLTDLADAVLGAGKNPNALDAEILGMDMELEMLPSWKDPGARMTVSRSF